MLSHYTSSGRSRSIIFPEGPKADGWFGVAKLLKQVLMEGHKTLSSKQVSPCTFSSKMSRHLSFAEVVRGEVGKSDLKGWRCRNCGS